MLMHSTRTVSDRGTAVKSGTYVPTVRYDKQTSLLISKYVRVFIHRAGRGSGDWRRKGKSASVGLLKEIRSIRLNGCRSAAEVRSQIKSNSGTEHWGLGPRKAHKRERREEDRREENRREKNRGEENRREENRKERGKPNRSINAGRN